MIATGWKLATLLAAASALILALAWQRDAAQHEAKIATLEASFGNATENRQLGILQVGELGREATDNRLNLEAYQAELVKRSQANADLRNDLSSLLQRSQKRQGELETKLASETTARKSAQAMVQRAEESSRAEKQARAAAELDLKILRSAKGKLEKNLASARQQARDAIDSAKKARDEAAAADSARLKGEKEAAEERRSLLGEHRQERARMTRDLERLQAEMKSTAKRDADAKLAMARLTDDLAAKSEALTESKKLNTDFRKRNREVYNRVLKLEEEAAKKADAVERDTKKLKDDNQALRSEVQKLEKQLADLIKSRDDMALNVRTFERAHFDKIRRYPLLARKVEELEAELAERPAKATLAHRGDLERRAITAEKRVKKLETELEDLERRLAVAKGKNGDAPQN